jgi:exodeoxyribonuclease VII large subunit
MRTAVGQRRHHDEVRFRAVAGRLETLSPLAVLGRGYAVCWTADRTRIVRNATDVTAGDSVRVTLARGDLDCVVRSADAPAPRRDEGERELDG